MILMTRTALNTDMQISADRYSVLWGNSYVMWLTNMVDLTIVFVNLFICSFVLFVCLFVLKEGLSM